MPKLKTKSGAKKRFRVTSKGRVRVKQSGKSHGMIKKSPKQIRNLRGNKTLAKADERLVKQYLPYAR
ncbi:MAG: 50S ribosomal protein L35 [Alphaproteobacteria bacterium]|nr:MAG: 50S ribosomal protein L35 [Alphaproteobacteria bacterium]